MEQYGSEVIAFCADLGQEKICRRFAASSAARKSLNAQTRPLELQGP
jgi:hypothetical protein